MSNCRPHRGLPHGLKRFDLLKLLQPLAKQLGLNSNDIRYLQYQFERASPVDFEPGKLCMTWVSVNSIALNLSMNVRAINRIENRLVRLGFIRMSLATNKRRFGERNARKEIAFASGVDLGPLIDKACELQALLEGVQAYAERLEELRGRCRALIGKVRSFGREDVLAQARQLIPRLRPSEINCTDRIAEIVEALTAIADDFESMRRRTQVTAASDTNDRPNTKTKTNFKTCSTTNAVSRPSPLTTSPMQLRLLSSERLRDSIDLYAIGAGEPPSRPSWESACLAARDTALSIGIRRVDWDDACRQLGPQLVALAFAVVDRNSERTGSRWHVCNVQGAFINLLRNEVASGQHIQRLWAALKHEGNLQ